VQRRPEGDPVRWLVAGYAGHAVAVPVVFFALARYRLPLEVLLLTFAAYAVARLADMDARSPRSQTAEVAA
jgi:hypothetical protein